MTFENSDIWPRTIGVFLVNSLHKCVRQVRQMDGLAIHCPLSPPHEFTAVHLYPRHSPIWDTFLPFPQGEIHPCPKTGSNSMLSAQCFLDL